MVKCLENGELAFRKILKCKYCDNIFEEKIYPEYKLKEFCSHNCCSEWISERQKQIEMNKKKNKSEIKEKPLSKRENELIQLKEKRIRKNKKRNKYIREFKVIRDEILERDNHICIECGSDDNLQIHHIVHRKNGGKNESENLQTLCAKCHSEKHKNETVYNIMKKCI